MSDRRDVVEQVRKRLSMRQVALSASLLGLTVLGLLLPPLLASRITVSTKTDSLLTLALATSVAALGILIAIRSSQPVSRQEAASAIDRALGTGSLFLTSLDPTATRRSTRFHAAFEHRVWTKSKNVNSTEIVPLEIVQTPARALLILVCMVVGVALVPAATPKISQQVKRVREFLSQDMAFNDKHNATPDNITALSQSPTTESLKRTADAIWEREQLSTQAEKDAGIDRLREALRNGNLSEIIKVLQQKNVKSALTDAPSETRSALERQMTDLTDSPSVREAMIALQRGDSTAAATALSNGTAASNTDIDVRPTHSTEAQKIARRRLHRILMTIYAQIGSTPPSSQPAAASPSKTPSLGDGTTAGAAWHFNADRYSRTDRTILTNYFERRRWSPSKK